MSKRGRAGVCVHCRKAVQDLTWDHVFPLGWYPDTTPKNLEKWKVPACHACNAEYGELERDLLVRLGLCVPPESAKGAGIAEKVLRSLRPESGRSDRDRRIRAAERARVLRELIPFRTPPLEGVLPGLGVQPQVYYPEYAGILIPSGSLERLGEKIVRGLTLIHQGVILGSEYSVRVYVVNDAAAASVGALIEQHGHLFERGPGIAVHRASTADNPLTGLYKIVIWGQLRLFAAVLDASWKPEFDS